MSDKICRRGFLRSAVLAGTAASICDSRHAPAAEAGERKVGSGRLALDGNLIINDDGHVFPYINDDLTEPDLRRYLKTYCREGVGAVAYCVGDMTWPTLYPTKVGVHYSSVRAGATLKRTRFYQTMERFESEPGGYVGSAFRIIQGLGKKVLASFRMNDAHFTSTKNTHVSEFWKQHVKLSLGKVYGYYGGSLNYAAEEVRSHFKSRVEEFVNLYPDIDGVELDAMRSPFFFPPDKGREHAPLFTQMVRQIKTFLQEQAKRLRRPEYLLTTNVPLTPELALECGLDTAAWDSEGLFDCVSIGSYQAYMNQPMERWKEVLKQGTPVFAYVNCSQQTGQYLGLEEYRAVAANAYGSGADGIYLFNYPCLFELASQVPHRLDDPGIELPDLSNVGQPDLSKVGQALGELGPPERLRHKDKRFLFDWSKDTRYRHYAPGVASIGRGEESARLSAVFRCHEDYDRAKQITLRFKIENVLRAERFDIALNGRPVDPESQEVKYAANGRDTRIHTVKLGPYLHYEISLKPSQLTKGENTLDVKPTQLVKGLSEKIYLLEIELAVRYG